MSLADKASLLLIPTGYKSQKVYSIFPTDGVGDFDFSRSSSATRIAKNGLITTVAANVPRLEYPMIDGEVVGCPSLILEGARTNLVTYSEDFSNAAWTKSNSSIVSDSTISPDGTLNSDKLVINTSAGYLGGTFISSGNTDVTVSFFVKSDTLSSFTFAESFYFGTITSFDLSNGTTDNGKIENYGNGWYRCSKTYTYASGQQIVAIQIKTGAVGSLYIFGGQYEEGSYPTSYIKSNSGYTTTRSAETCNGAGDSATFNDSEGVLMVEMNRFKQSGVTDYLSFGIFDSSGNNAVAFKFRNSLNVFYASIESTLGSPRTDLNYTFNDLSSSTKILVKYKTNDFALWVNGFKVVTDSSGYVPTGLNQLKFSNFSNSEPFNGNTKQVQYYNSALTDSELEQLTSWTSFTDMAQGQLYTIE